MKPCLLAIAVLLSAIGSHAQTTVYGDAAVGTAAGLGYKLPYTEFGAGIEQPIGQFELQGRVAFSPTAKEITNDGRTLILSGRALWWASSRFGAQFHVRRSYLWTSDFDKAATYYAPGIVARFTWLDSSQRLYLNYVIPTGGYDAKTGIEASRLQGPEWLWEAQIWKNVRIFQKGGYYRVLRQGNPLCDGSIGDGSQVGIAPCPRKSGWSGAVQVGIMVHN